MSEGLAVAALILSVISLITSMIVMIKFEAKEKSTHSIQMVPVDQAVGLNHTDIAEVNSGEILSPFQEFSDPEVRKKSEMEKLKAKTKHL